MSKQKDALLTLNEFDRYFTSMNRVDVDARISVPRDEWRALRDKLNEALAEPEQEPSHWATKHGHLAISASEMDALGIDKSDCDPLYKSPHPREWRELSDIEMVGIDPRQYNAISAALRAKNEAKHD